MAEADIFDDCIIVHTRWNEKELIQQIPGSRWNSEFRAWMLPLSWAAGVQLRGIFGDQVKYGEKLQQWASQEITQRIRPATELRNLTEPKEPLRWSDDLYDFQRVGTQFLHAAGSALLADEMGAGKTIQILEGLFRGDIPTPALVICPNSVKFNWENETRRWAPNIISYVIYGTITQRRKIFAVAQHDPHGITIINFDLLRKHSRLAGFGSERLSRCPNCGGHNPATTQEKCETHARELNLIPFRTIIVDEAHRIKDPHAKQTRACWALGQGTEVQRRFALTGTPIANDPSDLWSIMHFIAPEEYPTKSKFVDRYCLLAWGAYGGLDVKGIHPATRQEFFQILDPRFRRMPKALVLPQLPEKIRSTRYVELTAKQSKAYKELDKRLITRLSDGSLLVADSDLTAKIRMLQLCSASLKQAADSSFILSEPSPKVDALIEVLEELGEKPVAVCAEHRQLINLVAARLDKLNISYGLFTGGQKDFERQASLRDFQDGKLRVFLFTIKAGGTGINLTATDTLVSLQRSWSLVDDLQTENRCHRIGSEKHESVHFIDIVAKGTIEEEQIKRLHEKLQRLEEITRDKARLVAAGLTVDELDNEEATILERKLL